jgi:hypothetical protein
MSAVESNPFAFPSCAANSDSDNANFVEQENLRHFTNNNYFCQLPPLCDGPKPPLGQPRTRISRVEALRHRVTFKIAWKDGGLGRQSHCTAYEPAVYRGNDREEKAKELLTEGRSGSKFLA